MVLLVEVKSNKLVGYQKLSQNSRFEKVQLKFLAPREGLVAYEIHCLCSAYLGCDKKVLMKKTINKRKQEEVPHPSSARHCAFGRARRSQAPRIRAWSCVERPPALTTLVQTKSAAEIAEDDDEEDEEDEEEPEGKWYYLGGNSVGELILNIIALAIAGVMLFNFLYSRGLWQKYVQPIVEWVLMILWPFLSFVGNKLLPGWLWFTTNVYDFRCGVPPSTWLRSSPAADALPASRLQARDLPL